jgi:hypothetical protein
LQDRELPGRIGRSPLGAIVGILAPLLAEQGTWLSPQRAHLEITIRRQPSKSEFLTWPSQKQTKERATAEYAEYAEYAEKHSLPFCFPRISRIPRLQIAAILRAIPRKTKRSDSGVLEVRRGRR